MTLFPRNMEYFVWLPVSFKAPASSCNIFKHVHKAIKWKKYIPILLSCLQFYVSLDVLGGNFWYHSTFVKYSIWNWLIISLSSFSKLWHTCANFCLPWTETAYAPPLDGKYGLWARCTSISGLGLHLQARQTWAKYLTSLRFQKEIITLCKNNQGFFLWHD